MEKQYKNQRLRDSIFLAITMAEKLRANLEREPIYLDWVDFLNNDEPSPEIIASVKLKTLSVFFSEMLNEMYEGGKADEEILKEKWDDQADVTDNYICNLISDLVEGFLDGDNSSDSRLMRQALKNFNDVLTEIYKL